MNCGQNEHLSSDRGLAPWITDELNSFFLFFFEFVVNATDQRNKILSFTVSTVIWHTIYFYVNCWQRIATKKTKNKTKNDPFDHIPKHHSNNISIYLPYFGFHFGYAVERDAGLSAGISLLSGLIISGIYLLKRALAPNSGTVILFWNHSKRCTTRSIE